MVGLTEESSVPEVLEFILGVELPEGTNRQRVVDAFGWMNGRQIHALDDSQFMYFLHREKDGTIPVAERIVVLLFRRVFRECKYESHDVLLVYTTNSFVRPSCI